MDRAECQMLLLDQDEKGHTTLLSAFRFNFYGWLQLNAESITEWAAASASSFLRAVVRIKTSSANSAISASTVSEVATLLI